MKRTLVVTVLIVTAAAVYLPARCAADKAEDTLAAIAAQKSQKIQFEGDREKYTERIRQ